MTAVAKVGRAETRMGLIQSIASQTARVKSVKVLLKTRKTTIQTNSKKSTSGTMVSVGRKL
jgi:hypothetical protein